MTGSDRENGGYRDNIYISENFVIGGSRNSGPNDSDINISNGREIPAADPDVSLTALASLSHKIPTEILRDNVDKIISIVFKFRKCGERFLHSLN